MGILHCRTHPNILLLLEHFMKYSRKAACKYPIVHFAHLYPHILPIKYPLHISIYLQIFFGMSYHVAVFPTFCKENMAIGKGQRAAQLGGRCSSLQRVSKWGRDRLQQWWFNRGLMGGIGMVEIIWENPWEVFFVFKNLGWLMVSSKSRLSPYQR